MRVKPEKKRRILYQGTDKYSKVSHKAKILLLKKVFCDRMEIKQSSKLLNINYSTAKTLMRKFKTQGEVMNKQILTGISNWFDIYEIQRKRCEYKTINNFQEQKGNSNSIKIEGQATIQLEPRKNQNCEIRNGYSKQGPIQILQQVLFKS